MFFLDFKNLNTAIKQFLRGFLTDFFGILTGKFVYNKIGND